MKLLVSTLVPLALVCGCDRKADAPTSSTTPTPPVAAAAQPAAPRGPSLGPIPLVAGTVDLAALFPGHDLELVDAEEGEGTMPPSPPGILVREKATDEDIELFAGLDGTRITTIEISTSGLATPRGVEVGTSAAELAKLLPDATCEYHGSWHGQVCESAQDPAFRYEFETGDWGATIADAPDDAEVAKIVWTAPDSVKLAVTRLPSRRH